jgi:hypothetical protein
MGEIVNLRRARKTRDRRDAETWAQENRAAFGRTKAERTLTTALASLDAAKLDAAKLDAHQRTQVADADK